MRTCSATVATSCICLAQLLRRNERNSPVYPPRPDGMSTKSKSIRAASGSIAICVAEEAENSIGMILPLPFIRQHAGLQQVYREHTTAFGLSKPWKNLMSPFTTLGRFNDTNSFVPATAKRGREAERDTQLVSVCVRARAYACECECVCARACV